MTRVAWALCMLVVLLEGTSTRRPWAGEVSSGRSYGFVTANATAWKASRRVRVKVVTRVFVLCPSRDRPSAVLADSERPLRAALQGAYGDRHEITYRFLDTSPTAARARRRRSRALGSPQFGAALEVPYVWTTTGGTCR